MASGNGSRTPAGGCGIPQPGLTSGRRPSCRAGEPTTNRLRKAGRLGAACQPRDGHAGPPGGKGRRMGARGPERPLVQAGRPRAAGKASSDPVLRDTLRRPGPGPRGWAAQAAPCRPRGPRRVPRAGPRRPQGWWPAGASAHARCARSTRVRLPGSRAGVRRGARGLTGLPSPGALLGRGTK